MTEHTWKHTFFKKPTWCNYCDEFIWGVLSKQGYSCPVCKGAFHPDCKTKSPGCPGTDYFKDSKKDKKDDVAEKITCASKGPRNDLHWVCEEKDKTPDKLKEIIATMDKDHINGGDFFKQTPLHVACQALNTTAVRVLLETGLVDVNLRNDEESSPLHITALKPDCEDTTTIAKLLVKNGALIDAKNDRKTTPLQLACAKGNISLVKVLLDSGANLKGLGELGTALHCACYFGQKAIVQLLLEARADVNAVDDTGKTPIQMAKDRGHTDIVALLVESEGAKGNSSDDE